MFDNQKPNIILLSDSTHNWIKPLGPHKVAYVLREQGFEVAVINHLSIFSIGEIKNLLEMLISDQTLFVGINNFYYSNIEFEQTDSGYKPSELLLAPGSFLPHGKKYNSDIKKLIEKCNPQCKIVLGGPTAADTLHNRDFDYIVIGYAEMSVVNLARHLLDSNTVLDKSRKSIYGPVIVDDNRAEKYDFSQCMMRYEDHDAVLPGEPLTLEVARGCIFRCKFCSYPMNGKKKLDFIRSMDLIKKELIDNYERFGVTRYNFCDDTVNDSIEKCQMLYELSQELPFKLEWWGYLRLDLLTAHPETIDMLFGSGLRGAFFGIETLNEKVGKLIGKGQSRKRLFDTVKYIKEKWGDSVNLIGGFIYGLPDETMESLEQTTEFLLSDQNLLDIVSIQVFRAKSPDTLHLQPFTSEIEADFEKYGYEDISQNEEIKNHRSFNKAKAGYMIWKNQHSDFLSMAEYVDSVNQRLATEKNKIPCFSSFNLATIGVPVDQTLNKSQKDVDWMLIDRLQFDLVFEYKQRLYQGLNLPTSHLEMSRAMLHLHGINTFREWFLKVHTNES